MSTGGEFPEDSNRYIACAMMSPSSLWPSFMVDSHIVETKAKEQGAEAKAKLQRVYSLRMSTYQTH